MNTHNKLGKLLKKVNTTTTDMVLYMKAKNKKVYGLGMNDVNYPVSLYERVDDKVLRYWECDYYKKWKKMLQRCSHSYQKTYPTYIGCQVHAEWLHLSNFIKWVDEQPNKDWQHCHLDKDLLFAGNKIYSPETCAFLTPLTNTFITTSGAARGKYMIGVSLDDKWIISQCRNPFLKKGEKLGYFKTELEAHRAWQAKKHEHACALAELQEDPRVAKALRERYAPDKDWTKA